MQKPNPFVGIIATQLSGQNGNIKKIISAITFYLILQIIN